MGSTSQATSVTSALLIALAGIVAVVAVIIVFIKLTAKRMLSYEEVMKYIIEHKKDSAKIKKGAILREQKSHGYQITVTFMDGSGQPVFESDKGDALGYKVNVSGFDKDFERAFKEGNLIIVE